MTGASSLGGEAQLRTALVPEGDRVVVRVSGDADVATSSQMEQALRAAAAHEARTVVVDLAGVRFWDVSGLHVLAAFTEQLAATDRALVLTGATSRTRRLVDLAGFTDELHLACVAA